MPKDAANDKKAPKGRGISLETHQQSLAYVQRIQKQETLTKASIKTGTLTQFGVPEPRNTAYMSLYKATDANPILQDVKSHIDSLDNLTYEYDPKLKKDRFFNVSNRASVKQEFAYPLTTAHTYGWRQPIDFPTQHGLKCHTTEFIKNPIAAGSKVKSGK